MIIVLGLGGLDPYLVDDFGLENLKQIYHTSLEVPADVPLHTEVIWPTIMTGVEPEKHGLTMTNTRKFKNPFLQTLARVADSLLPSRLILPIGKRIQFLGFQREGRGSPEYYNEKGIDTIFTNTRAKVVGVPGYNPAEQTDELRRLGGHSTHEPIVEVEELVEEFEEEFSQRRKILLESLDQPLNIVMAYIYSTDMVGHMFWDDMDFIENWYRKCDRLVNDILEEKSESDELLVLSDHGMKNGEHRREAFFSSSEEVTPEPSSILDLKPLIDEMLDDVKDGHGKVKERLEDLGYI